MRNDFEISPLYLFQTIDAIDSFLGNCVLSKNKNTKFLMGSLDVDSLFTSIPYKKTINIYTNCYITM